MKTLQRDSNIELLRLIAMFFIVLHHFVVHSLFPNVLNTAVAPSLENNIASLLEGFIYVGVNCFVLISGFYGIHFNRKTIIRLFLLCVFYELVAYFCHLYVDGSHWGRSKGMVEFLGTADECVDLYLRDSANRSEVSIANRTDRAGNQKVRFVDIFFCERGSNEPMTAVNAGQDVTLCLRYESSIEDDYAIVSVDVRDMRENYLSYFNSKMTGHSIHIKKGVGEIRCNIDRFPYNEGDYLISCSVMDSNERYYDDITNAMILKVVNGKFYETGLLPAPRTGLHLVDAKFE